MLKNVKVSRSYLEKHGFEKVDDIKNIQETHMFRSEDETYVKILPNGNVVFMDDSSKIIFYKDIKNNKKNLI